MNGAPNETQTQSCRLANHNTIRGADDGDFVAGDDVAVTATVVVIFGGGTAALTMDATAAVVVDTGGNADVVAKGSGGEWTPFRPFKAVHLEEVSGVACLSMALGKTGWSVKKLGEGADVLTASSRFLNYQLVEFSLSSLAHLLFIVVAVLWRIFVGLKTFSVHPGNFLWLRIR